MWDPFSFLPPTCPLTWFPVWREDCPSLVSDLSDWERLVIKVSCVSTLGGQEYLCTDKGFVVCGDLSENYLTNHFVCSLLLPGSCLLLGLCSGAVRRLWGTAGSHSSSQQWKSYNLLYLTLKCSVYGIISCYAGESNKDKNSERLVL